MNQDAAVTDEKPVAIVCHRFFFCNSLPQSADSAAPCLGSKWPKQMHSLHIQMVIWRQNVKSKPGCRSDHRGTLGALCSITPNTKHCTNWWWPNLHPYRHIPQMLGLTMESCCIFYLGFETQISKTDQIGRVNLVWDAAFSLRTILCCQKVELYKICNIFL